MPPKATRPALVTAHIPELLRFEDVVQTAKEMSSTVRDAGIVLVPFDRPTCVLSQPGAAPVVLPLRDVAATIPYRADLTPSQIHEGIAAGFVELVKKAVAAQSFLPAFLLAVGDRYSFDINLTKKEMSVQFRMSAPHVPGTAPRDLP